MQHEIDRRHRQEHAGHAADDGATAKATNQSHWRLKTIRPRNIVNSQLKIFTLSALR